MPTTLDPGKLRPALHAKIDEMDGEALAILHRVALQLELDRLSGEVDAEFDQLREQGRLDRLPEILREARDAIRSCKCSARVRRSRDLRTPFCPGM